MTENVFTNAFNGMADSIANFSVTGKGSFLEPDGLHPG